jgi:hypothetical protein
MAPQRHFGKLLWISFFIGNRSGFRCDIVLKYETVRRMKKPLGWRQPCAPSPIPQMPQIFDQAASLAADGLAVALNGLTASYS